MQVELKLMGYLKEKTPADGGLQLADGATIADVLQALDIGVGSVHVFTVNGSFIRDRDHPLADGDELTVLPPVGGG